MPPSNSQLLLVITLKFPKLTPARYTPRWPQHNTKYIYTSYILKSLLHKLNILVINFFSSPFNRPNVGPDASGTARTTSWPLIVPLFASNNLALTTCPGDRCFLQLQAPSRVCKTKARRSRLVTPKLKLVHVQKTKYAWEHSPNLTPTSHYTRPLLRCHSLFPISGIRAPTILNNHDGIEPVWSHTT